jgi:hypothetical protein
MPAVSASFEDLNGIAVVVRLPWDGNAVDKMLVEQFVLSIGGAKAAVEETVAYVKVRFPGPA